MTPIFPFENWRLLRTKTDETTPDPDWVGTNAAPTEPVGGATITADSPTGTNEAGRAYTGVEIVVLGTNASRVPINRSTNTCDLTLVEIVTRTNVPYGGTVGDANLLCDTAFADNVPLQTKTYFPCNGATFTVRISDCAAIAGVDRLQVWWRAVSR